ncbi:DUF3597 family protein [Variovorax sp. J31P179]|nr:DUF3597 family protein [Variovorax sp. J31P179]MDM0085573.1 DUF3597 family protein [Variovorax sp. J31P179]
MATLVTAALLGSTVSSVVGSGVQAGASAAGGAATMATGGALGGTGSANAAGASSSGPLGYFRELAQELHYSGDINDSATMNVWLHRQVMNKVAANGGKVPADLKD